MKKKLLAYKEYAIFVLVILLFISVSIVSLFSIRQLQGNARVVNYAGIVRGATQKLVKEELRGRPNDRLISTLDSIVNDLIHGGGDYNLVALADPQYLNDLLQVSYSWATLKAEIQNVRGGADGERLFTLSEEYFNLVNQTVFAAERFSEKQVAASVRLLIVAMSVFVFMIAVGLMLYIRMLALRRRTETLNRIAYIDPLTQMPNRANCEKLIDEYINKPPAPDITICIFDMNNLKVTNDVMGHQGGDALIADFGRILKQEAASYGFVGRFGGDEFLAMFCSTKRNAAEEFIARVNERVFERNLRQKNEVEKISFAVGHCKGHLGTYTLSQLIHEADSRMYQHKRKMKAHYK